MSQEQIKQQIEEQITSSHVHIYMKGTPDFPQCGFSKMACDVFRAIGVEFDATNVLDDLPTYRAALAEVSEWPTIPQIFIDGEFVGGSDIVRQLYMTGELQKMVGVDTETADESA